MMKFIRWFLGKIILFLDATFSPRVFQRDGASQAQVDSETKKMVLYQFESCPFCVKVRRSMKRLNLKIELKDAARDRKAADELIAGGGALQVPCLRITQSDGSYQWLYESSEINRYFEQHFIQKSLTHK